MCWQAPSAGTGWQGNAVPDPAGQGGGCAVREARSLWQRPSPVPPRHADTPCGRPAIGGHFAAAGPGAGLRCACGNTPEVPRPLTGWRNALRFLARPERGPPLRRIRMTFPSGTRRGCFPAPGQGKTGGKGKRLWAKQVSADVFQGTAGCAPALCGPCQARHPCRPPTVDSVLPVTEGAGRRGHDRDPALVRRRPASGGRGHMPSPSGRYTGWPGRHCPP